MIDVFVSYAMRNTMTKRDGYGNAVVTMAHLPANAQEVMDLAKHLAGNAAGLQICILHWIVLEPVKVIDGANLQAAGPVTKLN